MLLAWDDLCIGYSVNGNRPLGKVLFESGSAASRALPGRSSAAPDGKRHVDAGVGLTFSLNAGFEFIFNFPCILSEHLNMY